MTICEMLEKATDTRACRVGDGVVAELPALLARQFGGAKAVAIVADPRTWRAAGERTEAILENAGISVVRHILEPDGKTFHAEYRYVDEVRPFLAAHPDCVPVAVGSGVVNDLVKRSSGELGVPYAVVATAASVDGYSSFGAALVTPEGAKQTYPCPAPRVIVADLEVMRTAPREMAAYGFADLMAKSPAGADWILAAEIGAAEWDEAAWHIVQDGIPAALGGAEGVAKGETGALTRFVEGLMASGFAMQAMQSSRPASGAEHMFSHILDMNHHTFRGELVSHGAQVGVFTLFMTRFHEELLKFDMAALDVERCVADWREWEAGGEALALEVFKGSPFPMLGVEQSKVKWQTKDELRRTLLDARARWPQIRARLERQLIPSAEIERLLKTVGAPSRPADIGVGNDFAEKSVLFAMFMRNRYNALDFAFRLGKLFDFTRAAVAPWEA